jgi:hypothetical protein
MSSAVQQQRSGVLRIGAAATAVAIAVVVYGAYGDPHPKQDQKDSVPVLAAAVVVLGVLVFALLVPRALRAVRLGSPASTRWLLGPAVAAAVLTPVVFWSGVPLLLGAGAMLAASESRTRGGRVAAWSWALGLFAVIVSLVGSVLGNTVLSGH